MFAPYNLPYTANFNPYFARYSSNGNLIYVKTLGGYPSLKRIDGFKLDHTDNIVLTLSGQGEIDLNPGAALAYCDLDYAIVKLDAAGNYLWSKAMGNSLAGVSSNWRTLNVDNTNNIYCTGHFYGSVDFSGGSGTGVLSNAQGNVFLPNRFLCKYTAAGNLIFAKIIAVPVNPPLPNAPSSYYYLAGEAITVNDTGTEIIVGMQLPDTFDIDPGLGIIEFRPTNQTDICLLKYDGTGNLIWHKQIISTNGGESVAQIEIDANANIYFGGNYSGNIYLNPGVPISNTTSLNTNNFYLAKYYLNATTTNGKSLHKKGNITLVK